MSIYRTFRPYHLSVESQSSTIFDIFQSIRILGTRRKKCLCKYFAGTELHGLKEAITANNLFDRLKWALLLLLAIFIAVYNTIDMCNDYLDNQLETSYSKKLVDRLEFPSVIICPKNPDAVNLTTLANEIRGRIPGLTFGRIQTLIAYAIAGAGMGNMSPSLARMREPDFEHMDTLVEMWKGPRDYSQFYTDIFEKHGYQCEDLFVECALGEHGFNCCDYFYSHYVMLRGRCFRLKELHQLAPDHYGALYLGINSPVSISAADGYQPQIVAFMAKPGSEISTFPRFYLQKEHRDIVQVSLRLFSSHPSFSNCHNKDEAHGREACYVRRWLFRRFLEPFNCTPFYLNYRATWAQVCRPGLIARNYDDVVDLALNETNCLPTCERSERQFKLFSPKLRNEKKFNFNRTTDYRLEVSYTYLEYEHYREIHTITLPGFVSQVGGQLGLFLGITIMSVTQILLNIYLHIHKMCENIMKRK